MGASDWASLLALAVLWGGSFFFIEFALRGFAPFTLVFARVALASAMLWLVLRATGGAMPRGWPAWRALAVMALLNSAIPWSLFSAAQTGITGGLASILNATTPIWGVVIAHFFTADEKATPDRIAGMVLGFLGVVAMIGPDALHGLGGNLLPQLACLVATLSYAIAGVYGRRISAMGVKPLAAATGQLGIAALILLPAMLLIDAPWRNVAPPAIAWAALLAMALFSTALAFVLFFRLLERVGATNTMLVTFLIPVTAILLGWLVLHETLAPQHAIGMALIALGLVAVDGRVPRLAWRAIRPASA
jgi:drug/metabolite transporter (DMT)-like permease